MRRAVLTVGCALLLAACTTSTNALDKPSSPEEWPAGLGLGLDDDRRVAFEVCGSESMSLEFIEAGDAWLIELPAVKDDQLQVEILSSPAFDSLIALVGPLSDGPGEPPVLAWDDDSGEGRLSRLDGVTIPETGVYGLIVTTYQGNSLGLATVAIDIDGEGACPTGPGSEQDSTDVAAGPDVEDPGLKDSESGDAEATDDGDTAADSDAPDSTDGSDILPPACEEGVPCGEFGPCSRGTCLRGACVEVAAGGPFCPVGCDTEAAPSEEAVCRLWGPAGATVVCPLYVAAGTALSPRASALELLIEYDDSAVVLSAITDRLCFDRLGCFDLPVAGDEAQPLGSGHALAALPEQPEAWSGQVTLQFEPDDEAPTTLNDAHYDGATLNGDAHLVDLRFTLSQSRSADDGIPVHLSPVVARQADAFTIETELNACGVIVTGELLDPNPCEAPGIWCWASGEVGETVTCDVSLARSTADAPEAASFEFHLVYDAETLRPLPTALLAGAATPSGHTPSVSPPDVGNWPGGGLISLVHPEFPGNPLSTAILSPAAGDPALGTVEFEILAPIDGTCGAPIRAAGARARDADSKDLPVELTDGVFTIGEQLCAHAESVCITDTEVGATGTCTLQLLHAAPTVPLVGALEFTLSYDAASIRIDSMSDEVCTTVAPGRQICVEADVPPSALSTGHSVSALPSPVSSWDGSASLIIAKLTFPFAPVSSAVLGINESDGEADFLTIHYEVIGPPSDPCSHAIRADSPLGSDFASEPVFIVIDDERFFAIRGGDQ